MGKKVYVGAVSGRSAHRFMKKTFEEVDEKNKNKYNK